MTIQKMSNTKWSEAIAKLQAVFQKGDEGLHSLGCVAMAHASEHFDARRMMELYKITGQSTRRKGFLVWVEMFSPIRISDTMKGGVTVKLLKNGDLGYKPFDLEGAEARPFWTLEEAEERTVKPLSADAFFKLLNGFKSKIVKAKKGEKYAIEGNVTYLENLVETTMANASKWAADHKADMTPVTVEKPRRRAAANKAA